MTDTTATPAPRKRVRLVQIVATPAIVVDDGEQLSPLEVQPVALEASRLAELPGIITAALAELESRVNDGDTPPEA